jgi:hypothetical protein
MKTKCTCINKYIVLRVNKVIIYNREILNSLRIL